MSLLVICLGLLHLCLVADSFQILTVFHNFLSAVHFCGLLFQFLLLGVLDVLQLGDHELQALS
jgi:hypothetical protein